MTQRNMEATYLKFEMQLAAVEAQVRSVVSIRNQHIVVKPLKFNESMSRTVRGRG
jgi:hypothetical protein